MEVIKSFVVRALINRGKGDYEYYKGYNRWTSDIDKAKKYPKIQNAKKFMKEIGCLLYTSPSPRDS